MHGREARFPLEAEESSVITGVAELGDVQHTIERLSELREKIFASANKNIEASQKKQKEQYKKRKGLGEDRHIKEGDLVLRLNMLKRTKKGHKREDTWRGPYKVPEVTEHGCCRLLCTSTKKEIKQKVNISQLKIYLDPEITMKGVAAGSSSEGEYNVMALVFPQISQQCALGTAGVDIKEGLDNIAEGKKGDLDNLKEK